ncbi:GatB/YqeY domain-containing protein [Bacteriovoracaceae bacterium]|nr:GatB/YqeY domain-containing protein [Bacteriovoracaceae bacterium]
MSLFDQVNKDVIAAMKSKEKEKLEALRYLKSLFMTNKTSATPKDEESVLISHVKKLKDSLVHYPADSDSAKKIEQEIIFISEYMPKPFTEDEVVSLIKEIISSLDNPQFGLVMKELSGKIKGKFDGKKATDLVKSNLGS